MDDALQIAICEDDKMDSERLLHLIEKNAPTAQCSLYTTGESFLEQYRPFQFDLLLIDIFMNGSLTGVETVSKLRSIDPNITIAFVTSSIDYTLEGYRLSVLKYIEKPCQEKEIQEILQMALMQKKAAPSLIVQKNKKEESIPFSQIVYLEQQTHHVNIYKADGSVEQIYDKLSNLMPELEKHDFYQTHKSYAANLNYVRAINQELRCFQMSGGDNVPIRRESIAKAKKELEHFLFSRTRSLT